MHRRCFLLTSLAGALAAPFAAEAQKAPGVRVVALVVGASTVPELVGPDPIHPWARVVVHSLHDLGWVDGHNIVIERYSGAGGPELVRATFADVVARNVDVILVSGGAALVREAKRATSTIPIVMIGPLTSDPVESGLVASFARPGGNVTGLTFVASGEMWEKRLQLLKELAPRITRVAFLGTKDCYERNGSSAKLLGITPILAEVARADQYEDGFAAATRERADGLFVCESGLTYVHAHQIVAFAGRARLPSVYAFSEAVAAGGLISYGSRLSDLYRRAAEYVDRILKGAKPADLPVEQPTKFELLINLKTAKALGLTIPPSLLLRADQVIDP
jgi:putative ABC transport system substrate-binding protein